MPLGVLTLRLLHVVLGVYWGGTAIFIATYLEPTVRAMGPAGGTVMMGLEQRGYFKVMPLVAMLTIVTGVALLSVDSDGFRPAWMGSRQGIGFSTGGLAAILAFVIGATVVRPTGNRMAAIARDALQVPDGPARAAKLAALAPMRETIRTSARAVAALVVLAAAAMAVARYLG